MVSFYFLLDFNSSVRKRTVRFEIVASIYISKLPTLKILKMYVAHVICHIPFHRKVRDDSYLDESGKVAHPLLSNVN